MAKDTTQKERREKRGGQRGGEKRDKSIENSVKVTGTAVAAAGLALKTPCKAHQRIVLFCLSAEVRIHTRADGAKEGREGRMSVPGADSSSTVSPGGDGVEHVGVAGRERKEREKQRESHGEALLSLTTQVEVNQGHTVRDLLDRSELCPTRG